MGDETDLILREEELWAGAFGSEYVERTPEFVESRAAFWDSFIRTYHPESVLEAGCGVGLNLTHIHKLVPDTWGIDVNWDSIHIARFNAPTANVCHASIYNMPFKDEAFEIVFTCGVLIHQDPDIITEAMQEIARCGRKVLHMEYESGDWEEIPYHGESKALWKGPYSLLYTELGMKSISSGVLHKSDGFDNLTWSLFEK